MSKRIELVSLNAKELEKEVGSVKELRAKLPKKAVTKSRVKKASKDWYKSIPATNHNEVLQPLKAVKLSSKNLLSLNAIHESETPTAEAIVNQEMNADILEGVVYSSMISYNYLRMKSEYKSNLRKATTKSSKQKVEKRWATLVKGAEAAYEVAGLKMNAKDIDKQAQLLAKDPKALDTVSKIASSAKSVGYKISDLRKEPEALAALDVITGKAKLGKIGAIYIPNLCSRPFAQGSFTKHFYKRFALSFTIKYWCPTWRKPWRTCTKRLTIASLSISLDLNIGYKVDCCGASAWGSASARVCGQVLRWRKCASCTASVVGIAGFARSVSGRNCIYGFGINASLICKFGNRTLLSYQLPIGKNFVGPCPPRGFCN